MEYDEDQLREELKRRLDSKDEFEASKIANRLGNLLLQQGRYMEAEKLFLLDYKIVKNLEEKSELFPTIHSLGSVYLQTKAYRCAESYMVGLLHIYKDSHNFVKLIHFPARTSATK